MTKLLAGLTTLCVLVGCSSMKTTQFPDHVMNVTFQEMKWEKIIPELGDGSPEIVILRVDRKTQATQLMIRIPPNFHVPRHWHTVHQAWTTPGEGTVLFITVDGAWDVNWVDGPPKAPSP